MTAETTAPTLADVAREVIGRMAPEELPLVEGLSRLDPDSVRRRLTRHPTPREPLGFGLTEVATLLSPVVWIALDEAARRTVVSAEDGAINGGKALWRRLRRGRRAPLVVPPLTEAQVDQVRARVLELAAARGVAPKDATALADCLGKHLAARTPKLGGVHDDQPTPDA
ncbi:MAG: hypothetical protein QOJ73_3856 [Streptosporangiaceae bacterium]|nr:hypothetical protein [Streptosporangiaceae bacterium]